MNPLVVAVALIVILLFLVAFTIKVAPKHGDLCSIAIFGLISTPLVIYAMQQVGENPPLPASSSTFDAPVADTVKPSAFGGDEPATKDDETELMRILETIEP